MHLDKCIMMHFHHYGIIRSSFTALNLFCAPPIIPFPFPFQPLATSDPFTVSFLPFPECHTVEIIQRISFSDGLLSLVLCIEVSPKSFHGLITHFFFSAEYCSIDSVEDNLFIHLLMDILVVSRFWQLNKVDKSE